jgi:hypothetical protein
VGVLVLVVVFILTVAIGAALAKGILTLMLHVITEHELPVAGSIRTAAFLGALIAFWVLAPGIAHSPAASSLLALVR